MDLAVLGTILINGICTGGVYGLAASALSFQLGALRVVNFAYGALVMLAMYSSFIIVTVTGASLITAGLIGIPIFFGVGWAVRRFLVTSQKDEFQILITMGLSLIIENFVLFVWGSFPRSVPVIETGIFLGPVYVGLTRLGVLAISAVILVGFHLFLTRTWVGKAIRAMVQAEESALLVGINVSKLSQLAFAFSCGIMAIAGALFMALFSVEPASGGYYMLLAFLVTVLGGTGNLWGSFLAGVLIGVISAFVTFWNTGIHDSVIFLAFIIALIIRPYGLFGTHEG